LLDTGHKKSFVAKELLVHKSVITREQQRNFAKRGYKAEQAQILTDQRRSDVLKLKKIDSSSLSLMGKRFERIFKQVDQAIYPKENKL